MAEYRIRVNGMTVASVQAHDAIRAEREAFAYALQYRDEGDVTVQRKQRSPDPNPDGKWFWKRHAFFAEQKDTAQ